MKKLSHLLHGENPGPAQLGLVHAVAALGLVVGLTTDASLPEKALFAVLGADWLGGIAANATRSTRAYYAGLPLRWAVAYILLHIAEAGALALLLGLHDVPTWLWLALAAKLAVFGVGQIEERTARLA